MTTTAEQFLTQQGIKFRVVAAKRGPGEWNVTFSRKGGGRLKLDFYQARKPDAQQVIEDIIAVLPERPGPDRSEYHYVSMFFTQTELAEIVAIQEAGL